MEWILTALNGQSPVISADTADSLCCQHSLQSCFHTCSIPILSTNQKASILSRGWLPPSFSHLCTVVRTASLEARSFQNLAASLELEEEAMYFWKDWQPAAVLPGGMAGKGTLEKLFLLSGSGELSCSVCCQLLRGYHLHRVHICFTLGR